MVDLLDKPASLLLLDELFEAGEDRFLGEVLACTADAKLKSLAKRWIEDRRPWARRMLLAYVDDGCDRPRHRALVKALLNLAEAREDDELMAHFLRAFDRLVRHELKTKTRWDWYAKGMRTFRIRVRVTPSRKIAAADWQLWNQKLGPRFAAPRFTMATRRYLRRRAFRYFRMLGWRDPARFFRGATTALALYRDDDIERPEQILDVYGLTSLHYPGSPVLFREHDRIDILPGSTLAELEPAPVHPDAWRGHAEELLRVLFRSDSLFVRRSLVRWLEREELEALRGIDAAKLRPLLLSPYPDARALAVRLLERATGLGAIPIADWLELLEIDDPEVLPILCRLVEEHVDPARLDLAQCVKLACARPLPVAELGFRWLSGKPVNDADALHVAMQVADAEAASIRTLAARWLLGLVKGELGSAEHLRSLVDARHAEVRAEAIALMAGEPRFADAPALWLALAESPYPDATSFLLRHLDARAKALPEERIEHVWATTLLSVHRGSRAKRAALRQIAERVVRSPDRASALLPILRVALRSVREAERRSALAAVCRAAFERPELRRAIAEHVPELTLFPASSEAGA